MFLRAMAICIVVMAFGTERSAAQTPITSFAPEPPWLDRVVVDRIQRFGHRNWIAVVDSAYPAQTTPGIETIVTGADHVHVLKTVLMALGVRGHVRPIVYVDAELDHVSEGDAPGIQAFRAELAKLLDDGDLHKRPHVETIDALDAAGAKFQVLVLKTNMKLPYTSVFIELDCRYWSPEAEERLREAMAAEAK
jgi:hypothetical protein